MENIDDDKTEVNPDEIYWRNEAIRERGYDPRTGKNVFTPLVAISLMIFYVYAAQCMATFAVVRTETNTWKWPLFMIVYMTLLAYIMSFLVYQGGLFLGFT